MIVAHDIECLIYPSLLPKHPYGEDDKVVIISGRTFEEWEKSGKSIAKDFICYVRGSGETGDYIHSAYWKAFVINEIDVDVYFEEDPRQVTILRNTCTHTLIVDLSDDSENPFT